MAIAGKDGDNGVVEFQFYQPDNRTKWEAFQQAIYDKSSNQFLGRTPKSWGQLLVFYSIFYIVLAALFAICMQALFATLDDREPKWKLEESLIGKNPGLGFRPISDKIEEGSLIWYNISDNVTIDRWVGLIDEFLEPYNPDNQKDKIFIPCSFNTTPKDNQVCKTTISEFGNCIPSLMYGYNTTSPCMFLKLNRIIDWTPKYFTTPQDGMPENLVNHILQLEKSNKSETDRMIWVTCNGVNDLDNENIKGFNYHPAGFASYYYPFRNVKNYTSPIVAVEILDITPNIVVSIECRAWASNIKYRGGSLKRAGSVRFEIQVDRKDQPPKVSPQNAALVDAPSENATLVDTQKNTTGLEDKPAVASQVQITAATVTPTAPTKMTVSA